MRFRFFSIASALVLSLGCNQQPAPQQEAAPGASTSPAAGGAATLSGSGNGQANAAPAGGESPAKAPVRRQLTMMPMDVAAGTPIEIRLETPVASDTSKAEDTVRGKVAKAIVVSGMTAIPEGAPVKGTVVAAEESARVKGRASIAIRFNEVVVGNTPYKIQTTRISRLAPATKGEDAKKIGIGAGVGTAIGAIAGGKKGAAIGAGVGAGAGTGAVLATRGEEVQIPAGTVLKTTIDETVRITAPM